MKLTPQLIFLSHLPCGLQGTSFPAYILPPSIKEDGNFQQHWCDPTNQLIEPCLWWQKISHSP